MVSGNHMSHEFYRWNFIGILLVSCDVVTEDLRA